MASIKSLLIEPPGPEVEAAIIEQFWANDLGSQPSCHEPYKAYFRYYTTECRRLRLGLSSEVWNSSAMVATTHEHILLIVRILTHETEARRPYVRSLIRQSLRDGVDEAINWSIDFALRVWLTINVRENRLSTPRTPTIQWDETSTLGEFITRIFPRPSPVAAISVQLDHTFTAANMSRLSGIDVEWTPCLADHLRLDKRRRLLRIYPYKQLLRDQLRLWNDVQKVQEKELRPLIPLAVIKETLTTLNHLFPHWDSLTDDFMLQHDQTFHLDGPFDDTVPPNLADFEHLRDRLLELHQIFNAPPVGWTQIWTDRRNPLQWYTFWLAIAILILTIFFGLISSITSVMQTYYAYQALLLTRLQLTISSQMPPLYSRAKSDEYWTRHEGQ